MDLNPPPFFLELRKDIRELRFSSFTSTTTFIPHLISFFTHDLLVSSPPHYLSSRTTTLITNTPPRSVSFPNTGHWTYRTLLSHTDLCTFPSSRIVPFLTCYFFSLITHSYPGSGSSIPRPISPIFFSFMWGSWGHFWLFVISLFFW